MAPEFKLGLSNLWVTLRESAAASAHREPILAGYFQKHILDHTSFADALSFLLAARLSGGSEFDLGHDVLFAKFKDCCAREPDHIVKAAYEDLLVITERDPAVGSKVLMAYPNFKGYHALQIHRIAHYLWQTGEKDFALYLQSRVSSSLQVDIHPAAKIGREILIDHGTGIVIGETAVVGDRCSLLHAVTLGGTGKVGEDRHPKVGNDVLIGAGAKILGNIVIGNGARVAAGAIVLKAVPEHVTVAGNPAKVVGQNRNSPPCDTMDQIGPLRAVLDSYEPTKGFGI